MLQVHRMVCYNFILIFKNIFFKFHSDAITWPAYLQRKKGTGSSTYSKFKCCSVTQSLYCACSGMAVRRCRLVGETIAWRAFSWSFCVLHVLGLFHRWFSSIFIIIMGEQMQFGLMEWLNDNNKLSIHHLKHIIAPKKSWNEYKVGDQGTANWPGAAGEWEFLIHGIAGNLFR